ncbi:hypothetical protein [Segeticoccus rhizosphaerae]|jgi:hypothetical protein|nr:hypothetical protein [Ornithinicoccus soli]
MVAAGTWSALTTPEPARAVAYAVMGLMAARLAWLMRPARSRRRDAPYLVLPGVLAVLLLLACGFGEHPVWIGAALLLAPVVALHAAVVRRPRTESGTDVVVGAGLTRRK